MAKGNAVWGIDIGQCSLKALRATYDARSKQLVADACDYIEYPKILSQPDADPEVLIRDAIKEFLSRNSVKGDRVAISVAGQQGLARFIKLPPVEAKKLPNIVEFEAKQQIPFALEDVIWDYQMLLGGVDADGMALENEVGLFAMKREQVLKAIRPLDDAGIELDLIQLSPVSIFNTAVNTMLGDLPPIEDYDPDSPPPSVVVLSMGTDTTDLVVTNGFRVWQRSIPLGGNHFTKQLTKELKLTFAKAEHLKRNSREADDPKKVFQAMRPVFNDMVTEVQRSIGYFESLDRNAKISHIVGMGNAFKLPGLEPYLEKNLGHKVKVLDSFQHLVGPVLEDAKYKENVHSMGVCYGLALQGGNQAKLRTNLIPRELLRARMIREKKPWVLAAASLLLVALASSYGLHSARTRQVDESLYASEFQQVSSVAGQSSSLKSQDSTNVEQFAALKTIGDQVVGNSDRRFQMLELMRAINAALPRERGLAPGQVSSLPLEERPTLYIETIESAFYGGEESPISEWFDENAQAAYQSTLSMLASLDKEATGPAPAAPAPAEAADSGADGDMVDDLEADDSVEEEEEIGEVEAPEEVACWVIELSGFHYHNKERGRMSGPDYVRRTLIKDLMEGGVELPVGNGKTVEFSMEELGISHVLLAFDGGLKLEKVRNPNYELPTFEDIDPEMLQQMQEGIPGVTTKAATSAEDLKKDEPKEKEFIPVRTNRFKVQFVWRPRRLTERLELREQRLREENTDNQVAGDL